MPSFVTSIVAKEYDEYYDDFHQIFLAKLNRAMATGNLTMLFLPLNYYQKLIKPEKTIISILINLCWCFCRFLSKQRKSQEIQIIDDKG